MNLIHWAIIDEIDFSFNRVLNPKKRRSQMSKKRDIGDSRSKSYDLLYEQLTVFSIEIGKKLCYEKILDNVQYMFV